MLLLLFAAAVRHTGGYAWAYNTRLYFQAYHPEFDSDLGYWLLGCSIGGGSFGVFFGGFLSDRLVRSGFVSGSGSVMFTFQEQYYSFLFLFAAWPCYFWFFNWPVAQVGSNDAEKWGSKFSLDCPLN